MISNSKIAIAGASGFIGKHLQHIFKDVVILYRSDNLEVLTKKLEDMDVVINLSGAPIVKRWSERYKKVLYDSRIDTTRKLVSVINKSDVSYFISTSAIGIYPNDRAHDESCTEYKDDFLASLCVDWEAEALQCQKPTAILRFGVVLGKEGGGLVKMLLPFKLGLGGSIGDGKMMTSWIAISDLLKMYQFLIDNKVEGIFNAVAPHPVNNEIFTKILGKVLHRPTIVPLPLFILKIIYGEASCILIDSKEIYPKRVLELGFDFEYPTLYDALEHIIH